MVFVIAVAAILLPVVFGILLATATARFDATVAETREEIENKDKAYNPSLTLGYEIKTTADREEQILEARKLAAKRAATLPRGANMRIGRKGESNLQTAWKGVENDPLTAVRIAQFHGWQGVKTGAVPVQEAAAAPAAQQTAVAPSGKIEVVAGRDYEHIEITDDMSGVEKRKARIANAKAKAAAYKKAKEAAQAGGAPAAAPVQQAAPAAAPQQQQPSKSDVAAAAGIEPPELIEITDDMEPAEIRKARIANAKAKSAYNKALKAAGIDPSEVKEGETVQVPAQQQAAPQQQEEPAEAASSAANGGPDPAALANIPKPDLIEITDDMDPGEIRKARIHNAKAKSAYAKELKKAGIDPKTVDY